MPQSAHAVACRAHFEVLLIAIINQRVQRINRFHPNITAIAAVTAIGTAHLDEFFTPKRDSTRSPVTGTHIDFCFIKKFHGVF